MEPAAHQVQEALDRILASSGFQSSERMRDFLRFVVQHKLNGDAAPLKEYLIADKVFGRGESFDPRTDTIVRVEARRLRSKLEAYYSKEGRDHPVIIELPERGYTPTFRVREAAAAVAVPHLRRWRPRPWLVVALVASLGVFAAGAWLAKSRDTGAGFVANSIAVLPCVNVHRAVENDPLANGLAIDIISTLAAIPSLRVVGLGPASQFTNGADTLATATKLGVESVLECSVQQERQQLRVTVRLLSAKDGMYLWSKVFDLEKGNALANQADITNKVVDALSLRLTPSVEARLHPETRSDEAYGLYLLGLTSLDRGMTTMLRQDLERSIAYLKGATEADPQYAAAHAGLADAYGFFAGSGFAPDPEAAISSAKETARKAVSLDKDSAEGHFIMGGLLASEGQWKESEQEYKLAIYIKPSLWRARQAYAVLCLSPQRRYGEAIDQLRQAKSLVPGVPLPVIFLGQTLVYAGRPEEAIPELRALALQPHGKVESDAAVRATLALGYVAKELYDEAERELQYLEGPDREAHPVFARGLLGYTFAKQGKHDDARRILRELETDATQPVEIDVAGVYSGLGETSKALEWLVRAHERFGSAAAFIVDDPRFRNLSSTPPFKSLLKQMGVPTV
jgi:serine/threonine-protein kinase